MSEIICVTSRKLCKTDFLISVEEIAQAGPKAVILREKDLAPEEYLLLAEKVSEICEKHGTTCILHGPAAVRVPWCSAIHLPITDLRELGENEKKRFRILGASCHSAEEAVFAEKAGCTYITAGHVFDTDCKKGLPGRGLTFLRGVCDAVSIPVYAIGGIDKNNYAEVMNCGAAGACVMSGLMTCDAPRAYMEGFENEL